MGCTFLIGFLSLNTGIIIVYLKVRGVLQINSIVNRLYMKIDLHVRHEQMMMNFTCILVSTCYIIPHVRFAFVTFHLWLLKIAKSYIFIHVKICRQYI